VADTVESTVGVKWVAGRMMVGADSCGRTVVISGWREREPEWFGLKASDMLLLSAAACASYDVVEILTRQREPLVALETSCTGEQLQAPPHTFTSIHLCFVLTGAIAPAKVERAVQLSMDKYCSVVNTLRPGVAFSHDIEIVA
jgi:putative redox protein